MSGGSGAGIGRDQARELARHELARSMYRPSLLSRWWHDFLTWLHQLTSPTIGGEPNWVAVAVLAIVAVIALAAAVYWLGPAKATRRMRAQPVIGDRPRSATDYRRLAQELAESANFREAIVELVRAIAADLEARDILSARPARTADELAAEAGLAFPAEGAELAAVARLFDDVRYGGRPGSRAGYLRAQALDSRIQSAAPQARADLAVAGASA